MRTSFKILASLAFLTSCSTIPAEMAGSNTDPESLLDMSLETVNVSLDSNASIDELINWINQDQPSRAELYCDGSAVCTKARAVFGQFAVPVDVSFGGRNEAVLVYERVMARDCNNAYKDNSINPYNLHHSSFGCSVKANTVQMVGDKRQFVSPDLLDYMDAERLNRQYRDYATMKPLPEKTTQSVIKSAGSR